MTFRRLLPLIGALLLPALLGGAVGEPYPGLGRKWRHFQSPNFELYSAQGDGDSRLILEKMELLRALFMDTFKLKPRLPQPVTIYAFDREADFKGYLPPNLRGGDARYAGVCGNDPDRTVITLAPAQDRGAATEVVYHEYIHHLFRVTEQNPAPWFNEGVAELYSTMRETRGWLELGHPVMGRVAELRVGRLMPFEQLFAVSYGSPLFKNSGHTGMFYAQSWVLLHYARFGIHKIDPDKLAVFLRVAGSAQIQEHPEQFRALCRELLGMDYPELQKTLERYVAHGQFMGKKVKRPEIAAPETYAVRPVDRTEATARLAELAVRMTDSPYGNLHIREQLERVPDPRLHEILGAVATKLGEADVARERWQQAVALGTDNAAVFRELARLEANLVFGQFDLDYRMPSKRTTELRHLLNRSLACAPEQSMGYEMLAWVEAMTDKPDIASLNLIQRRFKELNDRGRTLLALVIVRMRLGDREGAIALLDSMEQTRPSDWVRHCAEITRARLEDREIDPARLPESSRNQAGMRVTLPGIILPH